VEGDLDLRGFFGLSEDVPPGYTEVRAKVSLKAPGASEDQIQELHRAVVKTSPVGNIIAAPVKVTTELV
jgi:organic hydroperoxide reductase OsmC/OhrA